MSDELERFWVEVRRTPRKPPEVTVTEKMPGEPELGWGWVGLLYGVKEVSRQRARIPFQEGGFDARGISFEFLEAETVDAVAVWLGPDDQCTPFWKRVFEGPIFITPGTSINLDIRLSEPSGIMAYLLGYFRRGRVGDSPIRPDPI